MARKLLVLDTSYAYEAIVARGLETSVTCRDLDGFFEHVWTVHPFASLVTEGETTRFGAPDVHALAAAHTFIDGKIGRFAALHPFMRLNFFLEQSRLFVRLATLIRNEKISAIRAGDPLYCGLFGLCLARASGIPLVVRVGSNLDKIHAATGQLAMPRLLPSRELERWVIRLVLTRADLVAAPNQDNLDFALANGARPDRTTLFRYGNLIDKRHLAAPETRDAGAILAELWPEPQRFILHIGRLEPVKCPDDVLRVIAELRQRGHDLKAVLVGDGRMRAELGQLAVALGVEAHVTFCGNRDQEWLARIIPLAAAVVSPLTGRALAEAAFGGAPIVAYDLDWQRELVRTDETGILVPARDWRAMADGVERFLGDPAYARRMGDAARRRAQALLEPAALDEHDRAAYTSLFRRFGG
jgi:glycosyltransferase involved in cell wall biosynthesis